MKRTIEYNNAGVACQEAGHTKEAWALFKGALELKLAIEREESIADLGSVRREEDFVSRRAQNAYIQRAEDILSNITNYIDCIPSSYTTCQLRQNASSSSAATHTIPLDEDDSSSSSYKPSIANDDNMMYSPYIFCRPMRLPMDTELISRKESATVIFNLALVDHLRNRASTQSVQLYELAMTLLTGEVVDELGIALMNNIGAWCFENGDSEGTMACLSHLNNFLGACSGLLDQEQRDGLQANVLWMANSSYVASPAA